MEVGIGMQGAHPRGTMGIEPRELEHRLGERRTAGTGSPG
jgi:hypothetical protein